MSLLLVERIQNFRELWAVVMPEQVSSVPAATVIGWLKFYSDAEVETAIARTARKFNQKVIAGVPIHTLDADKYCSSVLRWNRGRK